MKNQNIEPIQFQDGTRHADSYLPHRRPGILDFITIKRTLEAGDRQKIKHLAVIFFIVILMNVCAAAASSPKKLVFPKYKATVVLDPGHGGNDVGAQNADGIQEKAVTLSLARMIADKISDDYKVVLTRTDDYWVDIPDRTAVANHQKSDIFISLHAGGAFMHSVGGTSVFYYDSYSDSNIKEQKPSLDPLQDPDVPIPWNRIQEKHLTRSRKLAQMIQSELFMITQDPDSSIRGAPLVVLKGADMPAVLIELGYLTHPRESKALVDKDFLALITDAIVKAIEEFLSKNRK